MELTAKILRHAGAMLFFSGLTVVMTEGVLRLQSPPEARVGAMGLVHQPSKVPGLDYELKPRYQGRITNEDYDYGLETNSRGMRDKEPAEGAHYIAAVGDSFTYGWGVEQDETFAAYLEEALNRGAEQTVDVLNFGVSGYATVDEAVVVEQAALKWKPEMLLLGYVLNDPQGFAFDPLRVHFLPWSAPEKYRLGQAWFGIQRRVEMNRLGSTDHFEWLHAEDLPPWHSVLTSFDRIRNATRQADIPVALIIFPFNRSESWADYRYGPIHRQVAEAGRERGFKVVDVLPLYEPHDPLSVRVAAEDEHPSPLGHRIVAEALAPLAKQALKRLPDPDLGTVSAARP